MNEIADTIVFYLMNEKGLHVLSEVVKRFTSSFIEYVVLSTDRNVENDYYDDIVNLCDQYDITYYNRTEKHPSHEGYKISIGWRWLIDDSSKLIVTHDSLLPKYRGFAPLVNMLINGEKYIGVSLIFASREYDKGDIILQDKVEVSYPIKIKDAIDLIKPVFSNLVIRTVEMIISGDTLESSTQDENSASYSLWRDDDDYFIEWNEDALYIQRLVDSVGYPYNGARSLLNGEQIFINEVEVVEDVVIENRVPGKVIFIEDNHPVVVCGIGLLKIVDARDFDGESVLPLKKFRSRFY